MTDVIKFNEEYIDILKKKVINFVSRNGISVNMVTFNLSLFNKFTINDSEDTNIHVILPNITNGKVVGASIDIDGGFFFVDNNKYNIDPDLEDLFCNKLTYALVEGASIKFKMENNRPLSIESYGISDISNNNYGFHNALTTIISEEINGYVLPDFDDIYVFNKQIVRMIIALIGYKHALTTYFGVDETLTMAIYSLSSDNDLFNSINRCLTLIKNIIDTKESKIATISDYQYKVMDKLLVAKKTHLINLIIDELYIPRINNVGLDERKIIRDEILKGFLGSNYINLKLNEDNKESYYWASLINNTVPINNVVSDTAHEYLHQQIISADESNMHEVQVMDVANKTKNNIKEFFVNYENSRIIIKNGKKDIKEPSLVEEILSYAYINEINEDARKKLEQGILLLCSKGNKFKCSLKSNPLNNKCLIACIMQLAHRSGYYIEPINTTDTLVEFDIKKKLKN